MHKILIVDDEKGVLEELSDYLIKDYEIITAGTSTKAIELLEGVDLAIVDMFMETEESGIEVLKAAKKLTPSLQCIVLTAYGTPSNAVRVMKEGAYDYVEKQTPDVYESLAHRIKLALEYKDSMEALRKSEEKYHTLVENLNEVIYTMDIQGYITYISPVMEKYVGYKSAELIGQHFSQFVYPDDLPGLMTKFQNVLANDLTPYEFRVLDKDNKIHYVQASSRPLIENGQLVCLIGILNDITEQKQAEEQRKSAEEKLIETNRLLEKALTELKATQQKIIQQERLRDMGQLASGIAHDFNNILTPILGYSDYMLNKPKFLNDKEKVKQCLNIIRTSAEDGREQVNRLSKFYRERDDNESLLPIDLNQLIQQTIIMTQPKWKNQAQANGVTIEMLTDLQDIPPINGKESEMREVLTNLIFNSVDALNTNGKVSIYTRVFDKHVILGVSDSGIGMTEEIKKRCFEPFFSTKESTGTGLGLSIVYGIIQRHEGTIEVESQLGKGTTFIIHLPISTEEQEKYKEKNMEKPLRPLHILVVDDEKSIQNLLDLYLTGDGHTSELANNGREGLKKFRLGNFDLVITDRAMPDIGGDQLANLIKQIAPKVPIIMITGLGNIMEASGEMPKNIDCLMSKPLTLNELRKALIEVTIESENDYPTTLIV